jgi:hypothetical protein
MERGTLVFAALLWLLLVAASAVALAWLGARFDLSRARRAAGLCTILMATLLFGALVHRVRRIVDLTEDRRASLPPAAARELVTLPGPLRIEVWLDRDDARRRQLESDTLSKLRIARADIEITTPLDDRPAPAEGEREPGYGRIVVEVAGTKRETFSTSRREIVTLVFEAAGRSLPDWSQSEYRGHPLVVEGARRTVLASLAYLAFPGLLLLAGLRITHSRRRNAP